MKIKYPSYSEIDNLTKEDFLLLAYINDDPIRAALHALGFDRKFMAEDGVEETILELVDSCLDSLRKDPKKLEANAETGRIRVEMRVTDENDEKELRIEPRILLDIWSW